MKIAVYSTVVEQEHIELYHRLFGFLKKHDIELVIAEKLYQQLKNQFDIQPSYNCLFGNETELCPSIDLMLSIGGDGTFLDAVTHVYKHKIPVAGINCGRLGFLADITSENLEEALGQFVDGHYQLEYRSMLELVEPKGLFEGFNIAMNDLTVHKLDNSSMIKIETYIDGEFLANYWADGLIISTPTGSTAYSLSVGGPIVTPNLAGLIVTPIASHHLTVRPVVVPDSVEIELHVEGRGHQFLVACDHRSAPLDFSSVIKLRKAECMIPIVRLTGHSFYNTLRNKLMWAADRRNV